MISSFFGKTKPINYIVLSVFLFLIYSLFIVLRTDRFLENTFVPLEVLTLGAALFTVFIINEIVKTEKVTDFSSYAMLLFVLLLAAFSDTLADKNGIFTNLFLLLALWRLLAIKSTKNVKHKIFDASFLICLASLFYDWAIVYLILVFVVINVYDRKTVKNWMVPLIAILTVFILTFTVVRVFGSPDFFMRHYRFSFGFLEEGHFVFKNMTQLLIYIFLVVLVASLVFLKVRKKGGGKLVLLRLVFLSFALGVVISLFASSEASPILVTFFPAAVFFTNYLETLKKSRIKEAAIWLCIVVPISLFMLNLNP